jgi:hypothetical protein
MPRVRLPLTSGTLLMAGGAIALAGVAYYVLTSDKKDAKGSAKELEGRAKGKVCSPAGGAEPCPTTDCIGP